MKILMVCLGNICRSPIAEGVMKSKMKARGMNGTVDSAAVSSYHTGEPPDRRAIQTAAEFHVDISGQRARRITSADFKTFDLILSMDHSIHEEVLSLAPTEESRSKARLFLELAGNSQTVNVPDPYYGDMTDFHDVFKLIDKSCDQILDKITGRK
jgi:protein-tyrosine phosphatase